MYVDVTSRTLDVTVSDVPPVKYDFVYCDVIGARITFARHEVVSLTVLTIDPETKRLVPIAYRIDAQEMWEPWLRKLVAVLEGDESRLADTERLVEEAHDKGNHSIDTDLLLDALALKS